MGNVHHLLSNPPNLPALECLEILELFCRNTVLVVIIALVNDKLRPEFISNLFLKLIQNIWADRRGIPIPVYIFFPCHLIKQQSELVKKCSKTKHIHIWMILNKFTKPFHRIIMSFRLAHIKRNLMLHTLPVICHCIVHMHRIPHDICKKAYRIIMERLCARDYITIFLRIAPLFHRHYFACSTVHDFPPAPDIISAVRREHIRIKSLHQMNFQYIAICCIERRHDIHLLYLLGIFQCPLIIFSGGIISGINFSIYITEFFWKICTVTIADSICSPFLH